MKKVSKQQTELIVAVSNEGLTDFPPAALEKDILLTEILDGLNKNENCSSETIQIAFAGGTSLIKGYSIISRMSEDLDFKIIARNLNQKAISKHDLGKLRDSIGQMLDEQGYVITDHSTRDSRRYFNFDLNYESSFDPIASLRTNIQLEFTLSLASLEVQNQPIKTLLYRDSGLVEPIIFEFLCVDPIQTAAEKLIGLLRKIDEIQSGGNDRLIRHVYDLHKLKEFGLDSDRLRQAANSAINEDSVRFNLSYPDELKSNPKSFFRNSLEKMLSIDNLENIYESFVTELVTGERTKFSEAITSLKTLVQEL